MDSQEFKTELVPGVGRVPFPAYHGDEPYLFVSYAHSDHDLVFPEIKRFNDDGFHVWYDEGISPGNEWPKEIAEALQKSSLFVLMATPDSVTRQNVQNEINFAVARHIPFVAIHLKETELPPDIELQIGSLQAIHKYRMTEEEYHFKYYAAFQRLAFDRPATLLQRFKMFLSGHKKAAVTVAAVLVLACIAFGIAGFLSNTDLFASKPTEEVEVQFEEYDEEYWTELLSLEPTPEEAFEIDEEGILTDYYGSDETVVIPDTVKEIWHDAFLEKKIKRVVIPSSVRYIGPNVFRECVQLEEAYISDGVYDMESSVFFKDTSLKRVRLPNTLTVKTRKEYFNGCTALEYIEIPDRETVIGSGWFINSGLKKIKFGSSLECIYNQAFQGCEQLTSIEIPSTVTEIQQAAFMDCPRLSDIRLNEGLLKLGANVFNGCAAKEIVIPNSVIEFDENAFSGCNATLLVYKGSKAEEFVKTKNLNYKVID